MAPTTRPGSTVRPSFGVELHELALKAKDAPYEDLPGLFDDAGFIWQLREAGATPMADSTIVMHYDVLIGKTADTLEVFDRVSTRLGAMPGPVSFAARAALRPTLIYLVFGRVPPVPPPQAARPETLPNGAAHEMDVDMSKGDAALPGENAPRLDETDTQPRVRLIEKREPDGLPILRDLFAIGAAEASTREVVDALLEMVAEELPNMSSLEQVAALSMRNQDLIPFVKDLGTENDVRQLKSMIRRRQAELGRNNAT